MSDPLSEIAHCALAYVGTRGSDGRTVHALEFTPPGKTTTIRTLIISVELMAQVQIIVGTVTGKSLEVAVAVSSSLSDSGHTCRINTAFAPGQLTEVPGEVLLLCTSNTGMGDLPANIAPLYQHLATDYPKIGGRRYGIINLGDSSYPTFAEAGHALDDAMADIGAFRVGEPCVLDAIYVDDHLLQAQDWAARWGRQL